MSSSIATISRGHLALRGLVATAAGGVLMAWPGITIGTVAVLFAVWAFADALSVGARAFGPGISAGDRALLLVRAGIATAAGVAAIALPGITASVLTVIAGLSAAVVGGTEMAVAGKLRRLGADHTGWAIAGGLLSLLVGVTLVVWPGIGAVTLALLFGAYLVVAGVMLIVSAVAAPRGARIADPLRA